MALKSRKLTSLMWGSLCGVFVSACATTQLHHGGTKVQVVDAQRVATCRLVGPVSGSGGGSFGGAWVSNSKLMEYAMNDLRNEAAERGATHVVVSNTNMAANSGGSTTTAVITGNAYHCTAADLRTTTTGVAPSPAATAPAAGTERGPCYGNGTCNADLVCASGLCVRLPPSAPPSGGE